METLTKQFIADFIYLSIYGTLSILFYPFAWGFVWGSAGFNKEASIVLFAIGAGLGFIVIYSWFKWVLTSFAFLGAYRSERR